MKRILLSLATIALIVSGASQSVGAVPNPPNPAEETKKVTICHRTNSASNPYNTLSVDADAADGNTGNDNGKGDHSEDTGPIATSEAVAQALKDDKKDWGDIIPAHDNYGGLNNTEVGLAMLNNDCKFVTGGSGSEEPVTPPVVTTASTTTTPTTQVAATPAAAVAAGGGGGAASASASIAALVASIGTMAYGALRFRKFNV